MSSESSCLAVTRDIDAVPRVFRYGAGTFKDLNSSAIGNAAPLVMGTWAADDIEDNEAVFVPEVDEVKFVIRGESIWKNADTGENFRADAGSAIWLPKGSRNIRVQSKDLLTFVVEATARPVASDAVAAQFGHSVDDARIKTSTEALLAKLENSYISANPKSAALHRNAREVLAGGNTRSVLHHGPFPMVLSSGRECYVTSEDGREYLDFVSEYTACMLGHSHPEVARVVQQTLARGINLGGASKEEAELASLLCQRIPSFDKVRFCNSGTEANTMALTLALNYTQRSKILVFEHGYHGGFIGFNKGRLPTTLPFEFVLARYNDAAHAQDLVDASFVAIIVEPLQSVGGMIPADRSFLQSLRDIASSNGAVLIFDEVVTSRLHYGALQSFHNIIPDVTTIGKFWGGGFSFGAFGGRQELMQLLEPGTGKLNHSGTFNNNAFTMTAGAVACRILTEEKIARVNALGDRLREGINAAGRHAHFGRPLVRATGMGSVMNVHFDGPSAPQLMDAFFFFMLDQGIYVARRGLIALNIMHTEAHVVQMLDAVRKFVESLIEVNISP